MKTTILATILGSAVMGVALQASSAPKLQFDQTVYDFGKTSQVETVTGTFKFKNTGDATLKLAPPQPSCGCTIASLKPDSLAPGESGDLAFTLNLGPTRSQLEKHIDVLSNDPLTPDVSLTIKVDYTPLYDINPMTLSPSPAFGAKEAADITTVTRTDGKPVHIIRLTGSKPWLTAKLEPDTKPNDTTVRIRVTVQREGLPRHFNEFVHVYTADSTNNPISNIAVSGQMLGEVTVKPEALYWSVPAASAMPAARLESPVLERVTIQSADGKKLELKNPQSTIKGLNVELVTKEPGKVYELVARLDAVPAATISGNVSFETSVADQSRIEVPVIVNVFKP